MQKEVNLVNKFVLIFPNPVLIIGQKDVLTTSLGIYADFRHFYANFSVAERTLLLIRTLFACLKRKGPLKMFTKSEKGADIEYIIIHLILFHPALLTLQKSKTKKYLKLMKKVWSLRFFSLICSIIKQLFNMGEGVVMLLEVKNACYSAKIANMLKNGFFLLFRIRRTFW